MALDFTEFEKELKTQTEFDVHELIKEIVPSVWFTELHRIELIHKLTEVIDRLYKNTVN